MPKLVAKQRFTYGRRDLRSGDTFDASRQDARVLVAIGRAKPYTEPPAAPPVAASVVESPRPAKRAYKRRDMRAE